MEPTKPAAVNAYPKDLVRLAEELYGNTGQEHGLLCDAAHEMDLLYQAKAALEGRVQQLEAKIFAIALMLRP